MYENHYHYQYLTISDNFLFSRDWLTVDEATERLYCFPCLLFSKKRKGPWVETGFVNLSYLVGALEKHEGNEHRDAVLTMKLFLKRTSCQVKGTLVSMNADEIERYNSKVRLNREIVKRIINAVIFLAKEEMAFRGHNEKITSEDRGPFKELLSMIAKTDSILFDHLGSSSVFRGDSKTIQNDLIHIVAEMTREIIAEEVDSADFFGVDQSGTNHPVDRLFGRKIFFCFETDQNQTKKLDGRSAVIRPGVDSPRNPAGRGY
ncbi:hypothetical protein ACHWQZ_G007799 [Mnemiopsis leidyi]